MRSRQDCRRLVLATAATLFTAGILGGWVGLGVSQFPVQCADITPGAATLVNFGSFWGTFR